MGDQLGARRAEAECYVGGKARYQLIAELPLFRRGLARLHDGAFRHRIAIMCAEKDPLTCHRAILVCRCLRQFDLSIAHISYSGDLEPHHSLEERLLKAVGQNGADLLYTRQEAIEHAYDLQSDRIAYMKNAERAEEGD
jgi:hypothetical protein